MLFPNWKTVQNDPKIDEFKKTFVMTRKWAFRRFLQNDPPIIYFQKSYEMSPESMTSKQFAKRNENRRFYETLQNDIRKFDCKKTSTMSTEPTCLINSAKQFQNRKFPKISEYGITPMVFVNLSIGLQFMASKATSEQDQHQKPKSSANSSQKIQKTSRRSSNPKGLAKMQNDARIIGFKSLSIMTPKSE